LDESQTHLREFWAVTPAFLIFVEMEKGVPPNICRVHEPTVVPST
jgi:hypothetical protein